MPFTLNGRVIRKIGVIGSGQIGPDIALYFSKVLAPHGVPVVVQDVAPAALEAGAAKLKKKIAKGVESGAFKPADAEAMVANVTWTTELAGLAGSDLVVEAATERKEIKQSIFEKLEAGLAPDAILASNSSHLEPEVIFEKVKKKDRTLVIHYFFPAERNLLVEVVPGRDTSDATARFCMAFYEAIGKVPIQVKSRYGYAIDPVFEGIFLVALKIADAKVATTKQVDAIAQKVLGLGVGPFTAMNLTGGNPITQVGFTHYHDKVMPWFASPPSLDAMVASKGQWETAGRGEKVEWDEKTYDEVSRRLIGGYLGLCGEILQSGIVAPGDLELGLELGLAVTPPLKLMNDLGVEKAVGLVKAYAAGNPGFVVADVLLKQSGPWEIPAVFRRDEGDVAVLTIKRPKTLNALNLDVYHQLKRQFEAVKADPKIKGAVLTGFGVKAFVSGADIGMLAAVKSPADGEATSRQSHDTQNFIENLGKPVVCAMNGLSLGGGSELAYACTLRIARKGVKPLFGQPEVKLGIIPGAGGSVRLPRLIDFGTAWRILRTGGVISGADALRWGLIHEEVEGDLVARGVELVRDIAAGRLKPKGIPRGPMNIAVTLSDVDLGHLSRKVDDILCKTILEAAGRPLDEALSLESSKFGEVCGTQDMRIGLENFLKTSLKEPAKFVHA